MLPLILIFSITLPLVIGALIIYARWNYGRLEALGIPVVKPNFIFGSTFNVHNELTSSIDIERFRKYGPVWGVYEGRQPQVHICDPEIIKAIVVKDFEYFSLRNPRNFPHPVLNEMSGFLQDLEKWKVIRQTTLPMFTPSKIKGMGDQINEVLQNFIIHLKTLLKNNGDNSVNLDIRDAIFTVMTDMMLRCVVNIKIDNPNDSNNYFASVIKRLMLRSPTGMPTHPTNIIYAMSFSFPFLKRFVPRLGISATDDFVKAYKEILNDRKKSGRNQNDFTEFVLSWLDKLSTPQMKKLNITEDTIMMQTFLMFLVGEDQVAQSLAFLFYQVALNLDIEAKIFAEIDSFLTSHNGKIEWAYLQELTYLKACMNESFRHVSLFIRIERVCIRDWEYDGGALRIKKGMGIMIPIMATHRSQKYYDHPDKFDPDRFMPGRKEKIHPYAFVPFGHGPRACLGMKFTYEVMLLILVYVYRDLHFRCNKETKFSPNVGDNFAEFTDPMMLDLIPRPTRK